MIGLDIGFGDVKAVSPSPGGENEAKIKFPTSVSYAPSGPVDLPGSGNGWSEREYQGRRYVVGSGLASSFSTRSWDFYERYAPLLAWEAVRGRLGLDSPRLRAAVGLPLAWYTPGNRGLLTRRLRRIEVSGGGSPLELDVEVYPQGAGALFDYRLGDDGRERPGTDVSGLVIDVGFNTVDVVAFEDGAAVKADSGMLERAGMSRPAGELARILQAETTINLSEQEGKEVLARGVLSVYGHEKDLSETSRRVVEDYASWLMSVVSSRWEDRVQRAAVLILAGGGARYLAEYAPSRYRDLLYTPEEPEFANARGFLKALTASSGAAM